MRAFARNNALALGLLTITLVLGGAACTTTKTSSTQGTDTIANDSLSDLVNVSTNANSSTTDGTNATTNVATTTNSSVPKTVTVSATATGFSPATVTIGVGGTVTWRNGEGRTVYVAPDDHPSHLKYSGIWDDTGAGQIGDGETYEQTFNVAGTYTYHDHMSATHVGTVIVE